jgi:hypothetical protein
VHFEADFCSETEAAPAESEGIIASAIRLVRGSAPKEDKETQYPPGAKA